MTPDENVPNLIFHVASIEGCPTKSKWRQLTRRVVRITLKGATKDIETCSRTSHPITNISKWNWNSPMCGPFAKGDTITFSVQEQLIGGPAPIVIAAITTKPYAPETLWNMHGKQGPEKDIRLPLYSRHNKSKHEVGALMVNVREIYDELRTARLLEEATRIQNEREAHRKESADL